ncbi:MAG: sulfatase [Acidobacteriota bacterium]|nr:sulfatase [Acidobacteriota bacterium]
MRLPRRDFLRLTAAASVTGLASGLGCTQTAERPNVLFIAADDLNDWVGCLGGHPDARTPNLDRLAKRGTLFTNAHCAATACSPSRTAILTGKQPFTTGVYNNNHNFRHRWPELPTLPQAFGSAGYQVTGTGKMFHYPDLQSWDVAHYPQQEDLIQYRRDDGWGLEPNGRLGGFRFGPLFCDEEELHDHMLATWVQNALSSEIEAPFYLSVGIFLPHLPWYVPSRYLERFPFEEISLPQIYDGDRVDIPRIARRSIRSDRNRWLLDQGQTRRALAGFLASVSFMDDTLGRVLDALDASPWADNTVIVFWSDHGFHLGEKEHWSKYTLWEDTTRVPLVIMAPGVTGEGGTCSRPVSLVDLYPTLLELCGLPADDTLDGASLVPLLRDSATGWPHVALTTAEAHQAVRTERWRYIRYKNGQEELYDHERDPNEWVNLMRVGGGYDEVREELASHLRLNGASPIRRSERGSPETD